jgi:hypothetical protein
MEPQPTDAQAEVNMIYNDAAHMLVNQKMSTEETHQALVDRGLEAANAKIVMDTLNEQIRVAQLKKANNDMLFGALWCIGGTVATLANIGFIFWGAIIFGGVQFFQGLTNLPAKVIPLFGCRHCDFEQSTDFEYCSKCSKNDAGTYKSNVIQFNKSTTI